MTARTIIFAGGGTGGHLFPGIAIAEEIARREASCRFHFLCSTRAIDAEILRDAGHPFTALAAQPFGLKPRRLMRFLASWGPSVRAARRVIRAERAEGRTVHVASMGGFVAPAAAQAARVERAKLTMFNLDATPGLANRWIARRADRVLTTYTIPRWKHATRIPPIARAGALPPAEAPACRDMFGLDATTPTLAILGGSQGAGTINEAMIALCEDEPSVLRTWQVIHQCGVGREPALVAAYERAGVRAVVRPFITEIGAVWGAADLAIARAGAGTVAEAWASETPTIFLPYPFHRDAHQAANATPLVDRGAAELIHDAIDAELNAARLAESLRRLREGEALGAMRSALRTLGPADGAAVSAEAMLAEGPKTG